VLGVSSAAVEPAAATILIVDDDAVVTQTFARMLQLEGFDVRTAVNPEAGLRIAAEAHPDAIIVDLRMPLMDGIGFLRRLRSLEQHRHTPVAIVTGDPLLDDDFSEDLRELRAKVHHKPFWLEELVGLARDLLKVKI
jgi:two-component system response regulator PrrA